MELKPRTTVGIVIPQYGLVGGAENFVVELTERLADSDEFEIHVLAHRWRRTHPAICFHKVSMLGFPRWVKPVSFAVSARRLIQRHRFDVVHSHARIFSMDLMTFHGIPHNTWVAQARKKRRGLFDLATAWIEKKGMENNRLKYILPVSHLVKEELVKAYPQLDHKVMVRNPGVNVPVVSDSERLQWRKTIRTRYGLLPEDVVVLFVGMNFEIKRLGLLIRGLAALEEGLRCGVKLLVVGKGDERRYREMARAAGIGDQVVFTGVVSPVTPYYLASDLFAMPSRFDTFGLVVLEAMASGLPVIISNRVGARDLVTPGVHGHVLPGDPSDGDMTDSLAAMIGNQAFRQLGERAEQDARRHTWEATAGDVADLYRRIAGHGALA